MKLDTKNLCLLAPLLLAGSTLVTGCSSTRSDVQTTERATTPASAPQGDHGDKMQLPPGWTEADMQACMNAGMPGPMHEKLMKSVGTWTGTSTHWMAPGMPPTTSPCDVTITKEMDGRYVRSEYKGEMPGMGSFRGLGYNGFDNVSQKFVSTWIDSMSTGIMTGVGTLSPDGKAMTWDFSYNCPITKQTQKMREVERYTGDDTMTLEMSGKDPKSGQEYQMMKIDLKRTSGGKSKS
jgi:hypothetical protein